ncbi:MAG: hypothetical protein PHU25_15850 [Deltaproteobacteria bacterium]|nr:hypothetical protein [Deltaproteobacteria bacterium]
MAEHPSRLVLARLVTSDLAPDRAHDVARHIEACESCAHALEDLRKNADAYLAREDDHLARLRDRVAAERRAGTKHRWLAAAGLAAALAAIAFAIPWARAPEPVVRYKGVMAFEVVAKRGDRQFRVEPGARLAKNDALRFVVFTSRGGYVSVFSVDATGRVSPFYPDKDAAAEPSPMALRGAGRHELPDSIILDGFVGDEYIVVVFSVKRFARGEVEERVRRAFREGAAQGALSLGPGFKVGVLRVARTPGGSP